MRSAPPAVPVLDVCTPASVRAPLARDDAEDLARLLKALADPTRLQILAMIENAPGKEARVCDLTAAFTITQPAISHHLRILTDAGLLRRDRRGSWHWYSWIWSVWTPCGGCSPDLRFSPSASASHPHTGEPQGRGH